MKKTIYLHLGFAKTATTSIQNALVENQEMLKRLGLYYPQFTVTNKTSNKFLRNHNYPMTSLFAEHSHWFFTNLSWTKSDPMLSASIKNKFGLQMQEILKSDKDLIFSAEVVSSFSVKELQRIKSRLSEYGEIKTLVFVKRPLSYLTSLTNQRIKAKGDIGDLVFFSQSDKIENIRQVFGGSISFMSFEESCALGSGPVEYFFKWLGLTDSFINTEPKLNVSLSNKATRLIKFINSEEPFWMGRTLAESYNSGNLIIENDYQNPNRNHGDVSCLKLLSGEKFRFTASELHEFGNQLNLENQLMNKLLGPEYCDRVFIRENTDQYINFSLDHVKYIEFVLPFLSETIRKLVIRFFNESDRIDPKIEVAINEIVIQSNSLFSLINNQRFMILLRNIARKFHESEPGLSYYFLNIFKIFRPHNKDVNTKIDNLELLLFGKILQMPQPLSVNINDISYKRLKRLADENGKDDIELSNLIEHVAKLVGKKPKS